MDKIQALIDGMSAQWQKERSETQMTLGDVIERLKELNPDQVITGMGELESYRGYYSDLAFEPINVEESASSILKRCEEAMGQVFTGYKGGEFVMGAKTPMWIAFHGSLGSKLMAINDDGTIQTAEDY